LQVGSMPVHQPEDVIDASFFISAGDSVPITVMRGSDKLTVNVQAASTKPEAMALGPSKKSAVPLRLEPPPK
jgi:S1-C subfamily serine protease